MFRILIPILLVVGGLTQTAQAANCSDSELTERYCERIELALECLRANYDCDRARYAGTAFSKAMFYLGQAVAQAEVLAEQGQLEGALRIKTREFRSALGPWRATSRDPNWILAVESANDIIDDAEDRLNELLRH